MISPNCRTGYGQNLNRSLNHSSEKRSGGSPPISSRNILNGIHFRLKTECQWSMIPRCYGSKSTIREHYRRGAKHGVFDQLMKYAWKTIIVSKVFIFPGSSETPTLWKNHVDIRASEHMGWMTDTGVKY